MRRRARSIRAPAAVTLDGAPVKLTSHEFRVLSYLMHHRGRVVSQAELTEHIYAQDADRDSNTVEVFIARLRRKLGAVVHRNRARPRLPASRRVTVTRAALAAMRASSSARCCGRSGCWRASRPRRSSDVTPVRARDVLADPRTGRVLGIAGAGVHAGRAAAGAPRPLAVRRPARSGSPTCTQGRARRDRRRLSDRSAAAGRRSERAARAPRGRRCARAWPRPAISRTG